MTDIMTYFRETKEYFEDRLKVCIGQNEPLLEVLQESINYSLYSGGKRIRPLFAFVVGHIFNVPREKLASLACALEMIHTASLIMDDLPHMDDAATRRGKPANHIVFGQDVASLASIGLLTRAYEVVLADGGLGADTKVRVVRTLANVVGVDGLVGGQFVDLTFANQAMEYGTLEYIHKHKTAALFVASGTTAAIIGDASAEEIGAIEEYAGHLGFAFQILDDLLDATGRADEVGKPIQKDRGNFVALFGADECRRLVTEYTRKAIAATEMFDDRNEALVFLGQMLLKRKS